MTVRSSFRVSTCALAAVAVFTTGCADLSPRQQGTAVGAGVGAGSGAAIGAIVGGGAGTGALIGGALGAVAGNIWSKRMEDRRNTLERATRGTSIGVERTADNRLKVNIPDDVSFDVGSANLKPQMRTVLDPLASSLQGDPTTTLTVIGFTDSTGTAAINNPLSIDRAQSVRGYLVEHGVSSNRIDAVGRGDSQPVATNATAAGRAQNRRVEIYLREPAPA